MIRFSTIDCPTVIREENALEFGTGHALDVEGETQVCAHSLPPSLNTLRVSPVFKHPAGAVSMRVASWLSDGCAYAVWSRIS